MNHEFKQRSMLVAGCAALALASVLFAAVTVLIYLTHQRDMQEDLEQQWLEVLLPQATVEPREVLREGQGYAVTLPPGGWEVTATDLGSLDLLCSHPEHGTFSVQVLDATTDAMSLLVHWVRRQRENGFNVSRLGETSQTLAGRPALQADFMLLKADSRRRHRLWVLEGDPAYIMDAGNVAEAFDLAQGDYTALQASFRLLDK